MYRLYYSLYWQASVYITQVRVRVRLGLGLGEGLGLG